MPSGDRAKYDDGMPRTPEKKMPIQPVEPTEVADDIENSETTAEDDFDEEDVELSSDDEVEDQLGSQPFRIVYQTNNFFLPQIRDLVNSRDVFNLRPEYQRRLRWTPQQKSRLIESLLLNIPVPPVFFYESDLATYEVMDGQQRLNAIQDFLSNGFALRGLQVISSLNGRSYKTLPPRIKRNLDRASISAIVLLQESQVKKVKKAGSKHNYELRRFVFERLNTGGKRLSFQEIRNAVYGGAFNDMIVRCSRDETFTKIWDIPPYTAADPNDYYEEPERQKNALYKTMGDCQLVLRFFALDNDSHIRGSMKAMLDRCMERNLEISPEDAKGQEDRYLSRLNFAYKLFDGHPFCINPLKRNLRRPMAGIYDGVMVALDEFWDQRKHLLANKNDMLEAYAEQVGKVPPGELTGSANTADDVKTRIGRFRDFFGAYL